MRIDNYILFVYFYLHISKYLTYSSICNRSLNLYGKNEKWKKNSRKIEIKINSIQIQTDITIYTIALYLFLKYKEFNYLFVRLLLHKQCLMLLNRIFILKLPEILLIFLIIN